MAEFPQFNQFLKERAYLKNVSTRTLGWYRESFKWLEKPNPTQADLTDFVIRMREAGLDRFLKRYMPGKCWEVLY
ncbi:MAG: hypothetical protein CXZ00_01200 [Acidobacteria bacterium]|nr:MAG: hypothetical protein CXZ00_01200 [Acidobacteriota bacterium]